MPKVIHQNTLELYSILFRIVQSVLLCDGLAALFLQLLGYGKGERYFHPSLLHNLITSIELFAQEKRGRGPEKAEKHMT